MRVDDILLEMRTIGAIGSTAAQVATPVDRVEEVAVDRATPGTTLRDLRGPRMVELLDQAVAQLGVLQDTFREIREIWVTEDGAVDRADAALRQVRAMARTEAVPPSEAVESRPATKKSVAEAEPPASLEEARLAVLGKIRGGGSADPLSRRAPVDEDDDENVPFVGQEFARPVGDEAVTVRSLGQMKVRLPGGPG
jgi:hypothetical protein